MSWAASFIVMDSSSSSTWILSNRWRRGPTGSRTKAWIPANSVFAVFVSAFPKADLKTGSSFGLVWARLELGYKAWIFMQSAFGIDAESTLTTSD